MINGNYFSAVYFYRLITIKKIDILFRAVTSIRGKAAEVKKEVPGLKDPETLHTMTSYGSLIFDISKLALMKEERIPTCVGQVLCDVCSRVSNDESETVYIDKKDIVYRHVLQVKRADGKMHVTARELVAIGL